MRMVCTRDPGIFDKSGIAARRRCGFDAFEEAGRVTNQFKLITRAGANLLPATELQVVVPCCLFALERQYPTAANDLATWEDFALEDKVALDKPFLCSASYQSSRTNI